DALAARGADPGQAARVWYQLAAGHTTAADIAGRLQLPAAATETLLGALAAEDMAFGSRRDGQQVWDFRWPPGALGEDAWQVLGHAAATLTAAQLHALWRAERFPQVVPPPPVPASARAALAALPGGTRLLAHV